MFDPRDKQLSDLQTAYAGFMNTLQELPPENFLAFLELACAVILLRRF